MPGLGSFPGSCPGETLGSCRDHRRCLALWCLLLPPSPLPALQQGQDRQGSQKPLWFLSPQARRCKNEACFRWGSAVAGKGMHLLFAESKLGSWVEHLSCWLTVHPLPPAHRSCPAPAAGMIHQAPHSLQRETQIIGEAHLAYSPFMGSPKLYNTVHTQ